MTEQAEGSGLVAINRDSLPYGYACEIVAEILTTPDVVEAACRSWAQDTGWHERHRRQGDKPFFGPKPKDEGLVFGLYGYRWFTWTLFWTVAPPDLTVKARAVDGKTDVTFRLVVLRWRYASRTGAVRTCERFARGVCADLASRGIAVTPPKLARSVQDRSHLKLVTKWRSRIQWALAIILAICVVGWFVTLGILGGPGFAPLAGAAWLVYALIADLDVVRERQAGRPAWINLVGSVFATIVGVFLLYASIVVMGV
jgi:hypothetical protein